MTATTTAPLPAPGVLAVLPAGTGPTYRVADRAFMVRTGIELADDEFVLEGTVTGYRTIARFTGRTRRMYGMDMLTVERWDIDTVADEAGVIWGRAAAKLPGTLCIRPDYRRQEG